MLPPSRPPQGPDRHGQDEPAAGCRERGQRPAGGTGRGARRRLRLRRRRRLPSGTALTTATSDWVAHEVARDSLESMLRSAGRQPVAAAVAYRLPHRVHSAAGAMSLAVTLEDRVATAYLGVVAVTSPRIREFGARELLAAATRAASWRGRTVAFPGFPAGALSAARG